MTYKQGTRAYGFFEKLSVSSSSAASSALSGIDEVLLCATEAMWITTGASPTATTANSIPLIAGEKFHMRVNPGTKIAAIRDSTDGALVIMKCIG